MSYRLYILYVPSINELWSISLISNKNIAGHSLPPNKGHLWTKAIFLDSLGRPLFTSLTVDIFWGRRLDNDSYWANSQIKYSAQNLVDNHKIILHAKHSLWQEHFFIFFIMIQFKTVTPDQSNFLPQQHIWTKLVDDNKVMQHAKYESSRPYCFSQADVFRISYLLPWHPKFYMGLNCLNSLCKDQYQEYP